MEIWLIRHTTPAVEKGICYGQLDLDVDANFTEEAEQILQLITHIDFDKIYSSPLKRCAQLAFKLFPNKEITEDARLKEIDFGKWEGVAWKSISKEQMYSWSKDYVNNSAPHGESFASMINRAENFISEFNTNTSEKIALVTHSGIIRALLVKYLHIPANKAFSLELDFGAIVRITIHSDDYHQVKFIKA